VSYYPDILAIFNSRSEADDSDYQLADEMESDRPFGMRDMQEWADSLAIAGGVLGAVYEEAGLPQRAGHYMRDEEPVAAPAPSAFDPDECTILRAPMTVRRGSISLTARKAGFFH
jgi:hypothetical protein